MVLSSLAIGIAIQVYPGNKQKPKATQIPFHTSKPLPFHPPRFANPKSRKLAYAMIKAEAHLGPSQIRIRGDGGYVVVDWDNGNVRQDGPGGSWSYRGGILSVMCGKGFFRGKANRADVLDYLVPLVGGADTFARQLLSRQRPFSDFFSADETVQLKGSMSMNGSTVDILHISGKVIRGDLMIRKADNLVLAAYASSLSPTGAEVYRAERTYGYRQLPSESVFRLSPKPGSKVKPLPKGAIKLGKRLVR